MKTFQIKYVFALVFLTTLNIGAQDFQGQAFYESKTSVDMSNFGGQQMSEERKKQIAESMKSMFEKTYVLTFNRTESIYKEEEKLDAPGGGGRGGFRMMSLGAGLHYKNVADQQLLKEEEFFGKQFLIKDSLPKLEWVMSSETKQIGKYTCFKATAVKETDALDFGNMRRRNRDADQKKENAQDSTKTTKVSEEIELPKEITITAWYTPQIPVNQGPGDYWGLPGLILEVQAGRTTMLCSKIVLNPEEKKELKKPSKGKEISQLEYNETVKKKMEEMRENFGGRNRGGDRVRIR